MCNVVRCPQCGHYPATVLDRTVLEGTDGPVEHVRIECHGGHWLFMPTACLDQPIVASPAVAA